MRGKKGITLIALVVTIIVLLILIGITISFVFSDNGVIAKARQAKYETESAAQAEQKAMEDMIEYFDNLKLSQANLKIEVVAEVATNQDANDISLLSESNEANTENKMKLSGAEFTLSTEPSGNDVESVIVTGEDGKAETEVTYNKNEETVYYVTATKAPEGYVLPAEEKKIVINENDINSDGTVQLNFEFEYSK